MFTSLPQDPQVFMSWNWNQIEPYLQDLSVRDLSLSTLDQWLMDWSDINRVVSELFARLYVATTINTTDPEIKSRFNHFLDEILTPSLAANQELKNKLLNSGHQPGGFDIPLRNMRVEAEI